MFTLSLGGTNPAPPNTWRGTIEKPAAAAAVFPRNSRRETPLFDPLFNRFNSSILHLAGAILHLVGENVDGFPGHGSAALPRQARLGRAPFV
jgi:hypothetical protein